jgi:DNA-directed RNA polymerase subunit alpha
VRRSDEELLQVRNFGETTLLEVKEKLKEIGLRLGIGSAESAQGRK